MFPDVGKATLRLLERAGFEVEVPLAQTCCGQPAYNGGFLAEARAMARQTLDVLDATTGPIVVPSGSCAVMLVYHIPNLVKDDESYAARARRVADRTRELTHFLAEVGYDPDPVDCGGCVTTYHASCHGLRWLQILEQPKRLLDDAGVTRVELSGEDECCGFGGLFSVKMPEVSTAMMATKIASIQASEADVVVGVDVSCLMHIGGGLRRLGSDVRTQHIAEVLAGEMV